jgi:hypothetical protein
MAVGGNVMSGSINPPVEYPIVELMAVLDTFVVGMAPIEDRGDFVRLIFWADHRDGSEESISERVVVARLVATKATYGRMMRQMGDVLVGAG